MEMSQEEMKERRKWVMENCTCENCPTYRDCSQEGGQKEKGFCFPTNGKSGCISEEKGCICAGCPVYSEMGLKNMYYCTRGSEKEQLGS